MGLEIENDNEVQPAQDYNHKDSNDHDSGNDLEQALAEMSPYERLKENNIVVWGKNEEGIIHHSQANKIEGDSSW